ncbi:MAG: hypothetical protein QOF26_3761 [Baekduia sp.]|jgi:hypothetical protein|nr:hypothetical protein [Baekduia sp.]MDX6703535.1 hypothetical protein [Baekduia sp.]
MAVICRTYASHDEARNAVRAVLGAGVPDTAVRVLAGQPQRDSRGEPEGEFAGTTAPDDVVGDFGGAGHHRDEGGGAFAESAAEQRGGSFADADHETITTYPDGVEHVRAASHDHVRTVLKSAGLDAATTERDSERVLDGGVVVLVDVAGRDDGAVEAALGG